MFKILYPRITRISPINGSLASAGWHTGLTAFLAEASLSAGILIILLGVRHLIIHPKFYILHCFAIIGVSHEDTQS